MVTLTLLTTRVSAFSLLGPYTDWMDETIGYRLPGDIGGPMDIGEGYRWNVPILTYAFDQSFVDFFGSNGVAAVDQAIQMLNNLPPASSIVLTNYPTETLGVNYPAVFRGLYDLKSTTLSLLLEQMGLAQPTRDVFALRRWHQYHPYDPFFWSELAWPPGTIPYYIIERNFDPQRLVPSHYVNEALYTAKVYIYNYLNPDSFWEKMLIEPVDPFEDFPTVADNVQVRGLFYTGLTQDDVGGLRYLLSANNVSYETLLPDVAGRGRGIKSFVNAAPRPGVEKITFVRREYDSERGQLSKPWKSRFTDAYLTNGVVTYQEVKRETTQPDFLFSCADTAAGDWWRPSETHFFTYIDFFQRAPFYLRTGTSNWINNAALHGNPANGGPGVIQPPVRITFGKLGPAIETFDLGPEVALNRYDRYWGSFDGMTNQPVAYPNDFAPGSTEPLTVDLRLLNYEDGSVETFTWQLPIPVGGTAILQTSTNLADWVSLTTVTNLGAVVDWQHWRLRPQRFFRALPQ